MSNSACGMDVAASAHMAADNHASDASSQAMSPNTACLESVKFQQEYEAEQQQRQQSTVGSITTEAALAAEEPIDYDAIPDFPDDITEEELHLSEEYFLYRKQNAGFQIPFYMTSEEEIAKIKPPAVVKSWEQRFGELNAKQQATFHDFVAQMKAAPWYAPDKIDDWCCLRYLIARSYDINKALAMLQKSIGWRKETGSDDWQCETCQTDPNQHMSQFIGWDKEHRPILFMSMRWGPERKGPLRHMVAVFNHVVKMMPVGVEKWVCMTDFATYSHLRDGKPSMGLSVIRTIQDHYPERLGKMVVINPPTLFWVLYKLFLPAIDPVTRTKVEFLYTEDKPSIYESFPKFIPPVVRGFLYDTYHRSKHDLPAKPLVWVPDPRGYPTNAEARKQQLKDMKGGAREERSAVRAAVKEHKAAERQQRHEERGKEKEGRREK